MISVIIPTLNDERRLVPTLASLVSGAADGIVIEAVIADGGSQDGTEAVADVAGCRFLVGPVDRGARLAAATGTAKAPWLMFMRPGVVLDEGWIREVHGFLDLVTRRQEIDRRAAAFSLGVDDYGLAAKAHLAQARLKFLFGGGADPHQGLLLSRTHYRALGGHRAGMDSETALTRRLGRSRVITLRSRATPVAQ
ncbi:MAG: glycosyltransferase [Phreatobacter sp.]|uniref:glycosyltransferase n=1 Tax=Phreatobacter sp. TaxID=1966341 RepID=UPI0027365C6C|nr:glycosyltransferase [Phreatobacter sp.]MDP2803276.1 glycosyltransferase [Phreatobacter sp.]